MNVDVMSALIARPLGDGPDVLYKDALANSAMNDNTHPATSSTK